jgi:hypothetical protein
MNRTARNFLTAGLLLLTACAGDDDDDLNTSSGDDGKYHPQQSGEHTSETAACAALQDAVRDKALSLGCTSTVRTCPGFLRVDYSPDCVEFDQGTVQGCIEYFQGIQVCADLVESNCVLVTYPGTEPAGCP